MPTTATTITTITIAIATTVYAIAIACTFGATISCKQPQLEHTSDVTMGDRCLRGGTKMMRGEIFGSSTHKKAPHK